MANFDEDIKRITNEVLEDGTVNNIIREKVVKGFEEAIESAFNWGDLKDAIKARVKDTMVPYIKEYDMSEYLLKLETCLAEVIKGSALIDQKIMLENFKNIMIDVPKQDWTLKEMLEEYKKFAAENIETDGMEIDYEVGVSYNCFEVTAEIEEEEAWYKSCFEYAYLNFKVEADNHGDNKNVQFKVSLSKYNNRDYWEISFSGDKNIDRLRFMSDFEVFLMKLSRYNCHIVGTDIYLTANIKPNKEPEPSFS